MLLRRKGKLRNKYGLPVGVVPTREAVEEAELALQNHVLLAYRDAEVCVCARVRFVCFIQLTTWLVRRFACVSVLGVGCSRRTS